MRDLVALQLSVQQQKGLLFLLESWKAPWCMYGKGDTVLCTLQLKAQQNSSLIPN